MHDADYGKQISYEYRVIIKIAGVSEFLSLDHIRAPLFLLPSEICIRVGDLVVGGVQKGNEGLQVIWIVDIVVVKVGEVPASGDSNGRVPNDGESLPGVKTKVDDVSPVIQGISYVLHASATGVGDDHLKILICLIHDAGQGLAKHFGAVASRDDNGDHWMGSFRIANRTSLWAFWPVWGLVLPCQEHTHPTLLQVLANRQ